MEQPPLELVLTEQVWAPGDPETERAGPAPAIWVWDGQVLEIFSWINGHFRFHPAMSPRIMIEEHKGNHFVTFGYAKGEDKLPGTFGIGKVFRQTGYYHFQCVFDPGEMERLDPLLEEVAGAWLTTVQR